MNEPNRNRRADTENKPMAARRVGAAPGGTRTAGRRTNWQLRSRHGDVSCGPGRRGGDAAGTVGSLAWVLEPPGVTS